MGCWYSIEGEMRVQDKKETRSLLYELEGFCGEINVTTEDHSDGTFTIVIEGGQQCSYGTAESIDIRLMAFGPYLADPNVAVCFHGQCDDEHGNVWVGSDEAVEKGMRAALLAEAREAIRKLTREEWEALCEETTSPVFWNDDN